MGVETIAAIGVPLAIAAITSAMSSSNDSGVDAANANKLQLMNKAQGEIGAYRPELMKQEMGAMNRRLGTYHGTQDALATMYGGLKGAQGVGGAGGTGGGPMAAMRSGGGGGMSLGANLGQLGQLGTPPSTMQRPVPPTLQGPPQMGNGPPMGTPQRSLPDPMQFIGRKPLI